VWRAAGVAAALLLAAACAGDGDRRPAPPPVKRFPSPIFDGLSLGMTRAEAGRVQRLRRALTPGGRSRRVWIYEKRGEHAAELIFEGAGADAPLRRIDVHFGPSNATPQAYIDRLSRTYGTPDVVRRKATINAYGDERHEQYDTIWSDATQYVFLTERVPAGGARGRPVYYLTIKKKEITAGAPPTGYVPPPPPEGEDGEPVEGDPF
jgi:hypothetical protein